MLIFLKLFTGSAQILTPNNAIIFTNEKINSKAKLFRMFKKCDGSIVDRYVLWLPSETLSSIKTIVMIDITSKDVGIPNSSDNDYKLYFGYFLLQSNNADYFISFHDGVKGYNFSPNLKILNKEIRFSIPEVLNTYKIIRIEL